MKAYATVGLSVLLCTASASVPTGLLTIPIADILRHRELVLTYTLSGTEPSVDKRYYHSFSAQAGLVDKIEFGFDSYFEDETLFNAKLLLIEEPTVGKYALSIGVQNVSRSHADIYAVGRYDLDALRLHLGWLRDDRDRLMLGVDFPIGDEYYGMLDVISGDGSYVWGGGGGSVPGVPGLSFSFGVGFPVQKEDAIQHFLAFTYGIRF